MGWRTGKLLCLLFAISIWLFELSEGNLEGKKFGKDKIF